jgi:peptide/nickel transport system substrate-binding protein
LFARSFTRRAFVAGAAAAFGTRFAAASGRSPVGGKLRLRVPWPLASMDPHRLDDPVAALFGDAVFDSLYSAVNGAPSLAEGPPVVAAQDAQGPTLLHVRLRRELQTARGAKIEVADAIASIARARSLAARAWLEGVPEPKRADEDTLAFAMRDKDRLVRALASPLVAIVPRGFSPERPDGTGPFRAELRGGSLALARNPRAARGPALLEAVEIGAASDLASSLRAFEAGSDDLGWLGMGLHEPRAGAKPFDAGAVAWAVLRTGREAGAWDAPGVAQRLCDGIAPSKLAYLGVGGWTAEREEGWGGAACDIFVRSDAPWLVEVARAVAGTLSRAGHEVTPKPIALTELAARRASRTFALMIDLVRPFAPGALGALLALATADDPAAAAEIAKRPPRFGDVPPRAQTRTLRLGIVGEVRAVGGRVPDVVLPAQGAGFGLDLGGAARGSRP